MTLNILSFLTSGYMFSILARILVLFTCIPVHECAHGWMAHRLGDDTAKNQGRLNLNPFTHLDLIGTLSLVLFGIGWAKPVPVNPFNFRGNRKRGMALTAAAGPAANVVLAFVILIIYKVFYIICGVFHLWTADLAVILTQILGIMVTTNISLAVFNLLPVNPLDGSRIIGVFLPDKIYYKLIEYERYIYFAVILLLFTGVLDRPISFVAGYVFKGLNFLTSFIDVLAGVLLR